MKKENPKYTANRLNENYINNTSLAATVSRTFVVCLILLSFTALVKIVNQSWGPNELLQVCCFFNPFFRFALEFSELASVDFDVRKPSIWMVSQCKFSTHQVMLLEEGSHMDNSRTFPNRKQKNTTTRLRRFLQHKHICIP